MPKIELTDRFIDGLKQYGMTEEDIKNWRWCGGTGNISDIKYWKMCFPNATPPDTEKHCICGQKIIIQNWITYNQEFIVIGSECRNKFLDHKGKSCNRCKEPHRNRKDNYCTSCREFLRIEEFKKEEQDRKQQQRITLCFCGKVINQNGTNYKQCYNCYNQNYNCYKQNENSKVSI